MKTKRIIGICLVPAALGLCLFIWGGPRSTSLAATQAESDKGAARPDDHPASSAPFNPADFSLVLTPQEKELLASGHVLTPEERERLAQKKIFKELSPTEDEIQKMGDTPVEFYGQVVDQLDAPVVGAGITCSYGLSGQRVSPVQLQSSAPNGRFEILDIKAPSIHVFVDPPTGYAQLPESNRKIQYVETPERIRNLETYQKMTPEQRKFWGKAHGFGEAHKPDKANPVIFRLKKL